MVNTGKPSTGCANCRARHIKCDEGKPACRKCLRTNRVCQGYRNPATVKFRNITQQQVKMTGSVRHKPPSSTTWTKPLGTLNDPPESSITPNIGTLSRLNSISSVSSFGSTGSVVDLENEEDHSTVSSVINFGDFFNFNSPPVTYASQPTTLSLRLNQPINDFVRHHICDIAKHIPGQISPEIESQAACFFASNFIVLPTPKCNVGYMEFLPPLLKSCTAESPLPAAFSAVSLFAFASRPSHRHLLPLARSGYVYALRILKMSIEDPAKPRDNDTVASTLLLAMIEIFSPTEVRKDGGWMSHIAGAARLLKDRGEKELNTEVGQSMFRAVRYQLVIDSLFNSKALEFGIGWWASHCPMDPIHQASAELNLGISQLRADTDNLFLRTPLLRHDPSSIQAVTALLRRAEALHAQGTAWVDMLLQSGHATPRTPTSSATEPWQDPDFSAPPLSFSGFSIGASYLNGCSTRLSLLEVMIRCIAWLQPSSGSSTVPGGFSYPMENGKPAYQSTPDYKRCERTGREIIKGIIATLPYFFDIASDTTSDTTSSSSIISSSQFACGSDDEPGESKGIAGMCCMWPMFSAARSDFASHVQREYLGEKLKYCAERQGIVSSGFFLKAAANAEGNLLPSYWVDRDAGFQRGLLLALED